MKVIAEGRFVLGLLVAASLLSVGWCAYAIGFAETEEWNKVPVSRVRQLLPPRIERRGAAIAPEGNDRARDRTEPSESLRLQLRWPDGKAFGASVTGYLRIPDHDGRFSFETDSAGAADIALPLIPEEVEISWRGSGAVDRQNVRWLADEIGYLPSQLLDVRRSPRPEIPLTLRSYGQFRGRLCALDPDLSLNGIAIARSCDWIGNWTSAKGKFEFTGLLQGINKLWMGPSRAEVQSLILDQEALGNRYGRLHSGMSEAEILKYLETGPKLSADGSHLCFDPRCDVAPRRYWIDIKTAPQIVGFVEAADLGGIPLTGVDVRVLSLGSELLPFTPFSADSRWNVGNVNSSFFVLDQSAVKSLSNEIGRFSFSSVFADDCILEFRAKGYGVYRTSVIRAGEFSAANPLVVRLSKTRVEIETWSVKRDFLKDLRVSLLWAENVSSSSKGGERVIQVAQVVRSSAVFENCAPGSYELKVSGVTAGGWRVESKPFKLLIKPGTRLRTIRLRWPH